jgi:hypothetical protein
MSPEWRRDLVTPTKLLTQRWCAVHLLTLVECLRCVATLARVRANYTVRSPVQRVEAASDSTGGRWT